MISGLVVPCRDPLQIRAATFSSSVRADTGGRSEEFTEVRSQSRSTTALSMNPYSVLVPTLDCFLSIASLSYFLLGSTEGGRDPYFRSGEQEVGVRFRSGDAKVCLWGEVVTALPSAVTCFASSAAWKPSVFPSVNHFCDPLLWKVTSPFEIVNTVT